MKKLPLGISLAILVLVLGSSLALAALRADRESRLAVLNQQFAPDSARVAYIAPYGLGEPEAYSQPFAPITITPAYGVGEPEAYALPSQPAEPDNAICYADEQ
jgi:hypothetical protein